MSNPIPPAAPAPAPRGGVPSPIDPARYPGLEDLRRHVAREGSALIDRVYRDAQAMHRRIRDLEAELELFTGPVSSGALTCTGGSDHNGPLHTSSAEEDLL